jgi:hypothetical protein
VGVRRSPANQLFRQTIGEVTEFAAASILEVRDGQSSRVEIAAGGVRGVVRLVPRPRGDAERSQRQDSNGGAADNVSPRRVSHLRDGPGQTRHRDSDS